MSRFKSISKFANFKRTQCFCGWTYGEYNSSTNCNIKCAGNIREICGGAWANSIYNVTKYETEYEDKFSCALKLNVSFLRIGLVLIGRYLM